MFYVLFGWLIGDAHRQSHTPDSVKQARYDARQARRGGSGDVVKIAFVLLLALVVGYAIASTSVIGGAIVGVLLVLLGLGVWRAAASARRLKALERPTV